MRGTERTVALKAIDNALRVKYARPETAHRAVGATLALIGARRLNAFVSGVAPDRDRQLMRLLAQIEDGAVRLSGIAVRAEQRDARQEVWQHILVDLRIVRGMLAGPAVAVEVDAEAV